MHHSILKNRATVLFLILGGFFVTNTLIAEFIGVKIFSFEKTLGIDPINWKLFGQEGRLDFTAGVLLWPVVFIMTDIINEYFGPKGVRFLTLLTVGLIGYAFIMIYLAIGLEPAEWWPGAFEEQGIDNAQNAFSVVYGQSNWIIVASMIAFLLGQLIDAAIFQKVRRMTGEKKVWLRANLSTFISQILDSVLVLYIAFVLGPQKWSVDLWLAVAIVNFIYKMSAAIVLTPLIYLAHRIIDRFLGREASDAIQEQAASQRIN